MDRLNRVFSLIASVFLLTFQLSGCGRITEVIPNSSQTSLSPDTYEYTLETSDTSSYSETSVPYQSEDITALSEITETYSLSEEIGDISETDLSSSTEAAPTAVSTEQNEEEADVTSVEATAETTVSAVSEAVLSEAETAVETTYETAQTDTYYPVNSYYTLNFSVQKAVWVSYLEYDRIMSGKTREEFSEALCECFDNIAALGCNTVYFQVRAHGDAYYNSALFPTASRLGGEIGGTADYDPLEIAVKAAHDRGLSIHAWINPMRLMTESEMESLSDDCILKQWYNDSEKNGQYITLYNGRWYLNPAYSEVTELICDGIREIVTGYDVDGIQIDDYFYPTTEESFDSIAYTASGTSLSLGDWRRTLIDTMVSAMYTTVHSANSTAVFGISPQGNADNNYENLYADTVKWCSEGGYCDYICPQVYYGFENETLPFAETADQWSEYVSDSGVALVIGLAAYKVGAEDTYAGTGKHEWEENSDVLLRQQEYAEELGAGYAFFRYDSLFEDGE